jgi:hypothetical protein
MAGMVQKVKGVRTVPPTDPDEPLLAAYWQLIFYF